MKNSDLCRCVVCNRNLTNPDHMALKMGPVCARKYFFENRGSLSDIYEKILNDNVAESSSSLMEKAADSNEKFKSMLHQVPFRNPTIFTDNVVKGSESSLERLLKTNPSLGGRTPVETILEVLESSLNHYPDIKLSQKMIRDLQHKMNHNFALYIEETLYEEDCSMIEAHVLGVKEFAKAFVGEKDKAAIGSYKELKIKEVYSGPNVPESKARMVVKALNTVSKLIPDKYKKNVPPVTLLIRDGQPGLPSAASLNGDDSVVVLNVRKNNVVQAAEAFHEYVHLIEKFNTKDVMKSSNSFLKKRRTAKTKTTIKQVAERFNKQYLEVAANIEVYEDHFTDVYAGRTYGDLDGNDLVATEVLTVGCEHLILDPVGFAIKDNEYFEFVLKMLKGKS